MHFRNADLPRGKQGVPPALFDFWPYAFDFRQVTASAVPKKIRIQGFQPLRQAFELRKMNKMGL
jgi:hypothetical protein